MAQVVDVEGCDCTWETDLSNGTYCMTRMDDTCQLHGLGTQWRTDYTATHPSEREALVRFPYVEP